MRLLLKREILTTGPCFFTYRNCDPTFKGLNLTVASDFLHVIFVEKLRTCGLKREKNVKYLRIPNTRDFYIFQSEIFHHESLPAR